MEPIITPIGTSRSNAGPAGSTHSCQLHNHVVKTNNNSNNNNYYDSSNNNKRLNNTTTIMVKTLLLITTVIKIEISVLLDTF